MEGDGGRGEEEEEEGKDSYSSFEHRPGGSAIASRTPQDLSHASCRQRRALKRASIYLFIYLFTIFIYLFIPIADVFHRAQGAGWGARRGAWRGRYSQHGARLEAPRSVM